MTELILELDKKANQSLKDLMKHYGVSTKAEVIKKGINLLKIAAYVDNTQGELFVRNGTHESKIIF